jgi:hypothetical protein
MVTMGHAGSGNFVRSFGCAQDAVILPHPHPPKPPFQAILSLKTAHSRLPAGQRFGIIAPVIEQLRGTCGPGRVRRDCDCRESVQELRTQFAMPGGRAASAGE